MGWVRNSYFEFLEKIEIGLIKICAKFFSDILYSFIIFIGKEIYFSVQYLLAALTDYSTIYFDNVSILFLLAGNAPVRIRERVRVKILAIFFNNRKRKGSKIELSLICPPVLTNSFNSI